MSKSELEKDAYVYGDVCVRKIRRKRQKLLIVELFFDYAANSTLHGLRYIAQRGLSIVEKLFWFITFALSVTMCAFLIRNVYLKWKYSPVIVTVSEKMVSAGTVPFPAVTICPEIRVMKSVHNYDKIDDEYNINTQSASNITDSEIYFHQHVGNICDRNVCDNGRNVTNASIIDDITEVAPKEDDTITYCLINAKDIKCTDIFSRVYTEYGLCFTMNTLAADEMFNKKAIQPHYNYLESTQKSKGWSLEKGYQFSVNDSYPKRVSVGRKVNLDVYLKFDTADRNSLCNGEYSGFKIFLQHPADLPQASKYYYAAIEKQVTSLAINFNQLNSDPNLRNYPVEVRQCYFPEDRKLRYFNNYTMNNCQAECISNYTYEICKCVKFYMPHNDSNEICACHDGCVARAMEIMAEKEIAAELDPNLEACRCLPACNSIEYDAEVLKTSYNEEILFEHYFGEWDTSLKRSRISLYFKKPYFVAMRRSELFGTTDFLSNIGGLLGLFLGFSFLSLVEIVYFLTLRIGFTLKRDLDEEKKNKIPHTNSEKDQ